MVNQHTRRRYCHSCTCPGVIVPAYRLFQDLQYYTVSDPGLLSDAT